MNFELTDEQQHIQSTARELLARRVTREALEGGGFDEALWAEVSQLGWPGLAIAEEHGGQGLGVLELTLLAEELGRTLAPVPLLANASAALVLSHAGSPEQQARLLPALASGEGRGALAAGALAPDAADARTLVVCDGERAWLAGPGTIATPAASIDITRRYATVDADPGEPLPGPAGPALDRAEILLAAELVGVAQRALELAVEYAGDRKQFGRPIGAFQGVSHRCARMLLDVETSRALTRYAAWTADHDEDALPLAAAVAKSAAADAAWRVTSSSLQVHGGIGFTWEHDIHLLLKRARAAGQLLGTATEQRRRIGALRRRDLAPALV